MKAETKKVLIGVGLVFGGLFLLGKLFKFLVKPSEEELAKLDGNVLLSRGSQGNEVMELQRILKDELGYDLGNFGVLGDGVDGNFGAITENALMNAKGVKQITLNEMRNEK